ncbi:MAG: hypothetical protein J6M34_07200 [Clostridia bacterium]|nr:hypothetical protein [Clostridia bacterium]
MRKVKRLIQVFLIVVFAVCLINFVVKKIDIAATDAKIDDVKKQLVATKVNNGELQGLLDNIGDLMQEIAEDTLKMGDPGVKVFEFIPE